MHRKHVLRGGGDGHAWKREGQSTSGRFKRGRSRIHSCSNGEDCAGHQNDPSPNASLSAVASKTRCSIIHSRRRPCGSPQDEPFSPVHSIANEKSLLGQWRRLLAHVACRPRRSMWLYNAGRLCRRHETTHFGSKHPPTRGGSRVLLHI